MILNQAMEGKNGISRTTSNESNKNNGLSKENRINKSLKRFDKPRFFWLLLFYTCSRLVFYSFI